MDKVTNTKILKRTGLPSMEDLQKESPVDWAPHEDVTRQATKAGSLLSTVFWLQTERAPGSRIPSSKRNLKLRYIKTDSWTPHSREINGEQ